MEGYAKQPSAVCGSERVLQRELHQSGRRRVYHMPKQRIVDVAIHRLRTEKLRCVENVERFPADLQHLRFADLEISLQYQIRVEHARSGESTGAAHHRVCPGHLR